MRLKLGQLEWEGENGAHAFVPVEDIGLVIIESSQVVITCALIQALSSVNAVVVFCGNNHMPASLLTPMAGHTLMQKVLRAQITAPSLQKDILWGKIVKSKIENQGKVAGIFNKTLGRDLRNLSKEVKRADPANIEAQAAKTYFSIFENNGIAFSRTPGTGILNSALDYGYSVLRAATARSLVSSGMNCALGIHHHSQYISFCLADDIMEPYRPFVDFMVLSNFDTFASEDKLTTEMKKNLISCLTMDVTVSEMKRPLSNALQLTTASLARCFTDGTYDIVCPSVPEYR